MRKIEKDKKTLNVDDKQRRWIINVDVSRNPFISKSQIMHSKLRYSPMVIHDIENPYTCRCIIISNLYLKLYTYNNIFMYLINLTST